MASPRPQCPSRALRLRSSGAAGCRRWRLAARAAIRAQSRPLRGAAVVSLVMQTTQLELRAARPLRATPFCRIACSTGSSCARRCLGESMRRIGVRHEQVILASHRPHETCRRAAARVSRSRVRKGRSETGRPLRVRWWMPDRGGAARYGCAPAQLAWIEGLRDVVVGAEFEHDDRRSLALEAPAQIAAVKGAQERTRGRSSASRPKSSGSRKGC